MGNKKNKKNKGKGTKINLGNNFVEVLIPSIIILATIIFIGITLINTRLNISKPVAEADLWATAFENVESQKIGVQFNQINTDEKTYTDLRVECNKYIEQIDKKPDITVDVDAIIEEAVFVDNNERKTKEINNTMNDISETGPIYFNNKLILRYMTQSGELKIVAAMVKENKDIIISNKNDIHYKLANDQKEENKLEGNLISEDEYLKDLGSLVVNLMEASTVKKLNGYQKEALNYFTLDGNKSVIDSRKTTNINNKSKIQMVYIEAGKSSMDSLYKDRVYMQIISKEGKNIETFGIILKLNQNSRVFDIDVI